MHVLKAHGTKRQSWECTFWFSERKIIGCCQNTFPSLFQYYLLWGWFSWFTLYPTWKPKLYTEIGRGFQSRIGKRAVGWFWKEGRRCLTSSNTHVNSFPSSTEWLARDNPRGMSTRGEGGHFFFCCSKGDPSQRRRVGSCLTLENELSEETQVLRKQETLLGRGIWAERKRVKEFRRPALPGGSQSWVLW